MHGLKGLRRHALIFGTITSLIATGLWVQLEGAAATSTNPDKIQYNQTTGASGTYIRYIPGDGSAPTNQSVTSGGGCATPTPNGPAILAFSAKYYANGYGGSSVNAIVGAYKSRTGVCRIPQAWSIEVNEALIFRPGSNTLTVGRLFTRAQIQLQREDKPTTIPGPPTTGQLIKLLGSTPVGTPTNFSISGGAGGTPITADTGTVAGGFDSVEIRVLTPSTGSVSVVGPTSTFTLAGQVCPGESITTSSNDVKATLTLLPGSSCKSYTEFSASSEDKSVTFLSRQAAGAHMTASFDWGYFTYCRADGVSDPNVPACPVTKVDFGDLVLHDETYCAAVDPGAQTSPPYDPPPWCATSRHVDYVEYPVGSGVTVAHITETWDGLGDIIWRH
ncbi:MAG: hypothetical protein M3Q30_19215 [Actinomycetota bacterium]|nr:hypothetical protein [Actinomycetota bacterium]